MTSHDYGAAETTTPRDRKELLRTLISEIVLIVKENPRRAEIEIVWEGGAHTKLQVALVRCGLETTRTSQDTTELIRQLAAHHPDQQIAAILNKQGRLTGTGLPFTEPRVKRVRKQHHIPAAPPSEPTSDIYSIIQAASELGVTNTTIYRRLRAGLLPGEQTTRTPPSVSELPKRSAPSSCPTFPRTTYHSTKPPNASGSPARPFAQGPTQRASRHSSHNRTTKGPKNPGDNTTTGLFDQ